jgi:hypothetical protein
VCCWQRVPEYREACRSLGLTCGDLLGFSVLLLRDTAKENVRRTPSGGRTIARIDSTEFQPGSRGSSFRTADLAWTASTAVMARNAVWE